MKLIPSIVGLAALTGLHACGHAAEPSPELLSLVVYAAGKPVAVQTVGIAPDHGACEEGKKIVLEKIQAPPNTVIVGVCSPIPAGVAGA